MTIADLLCVAQYYPILFGIYVVVWAALIVFGAAGVVSMLRNATAAVPWVMLTMAAAYVLFTLSSFFATCDPTRPLGTPVLGG